MATVFSTAALLACACVSAQGQVPPPPPGMPAREFSPQAQVMPPLEADTLFPGVQLSDVIVMGSYAPMAYEDYWRIKRRVKKVWPYAVLASQYLHEMDSLRGEMSERKFRKEVDRRQKELFDNFAGILKKFSRSEGKILIKLVYRQTGISTYDIARELKSGFKAFWWNASAGMFSLSLKDEYDPRLYPDDYVIERILRECFAEGELPIYPSYNEFVSPFYYRKVEQDIARDQLRRQEMEKLEKKRVRQLKKQERRDERAMR
ncbi:MAG TPA: DUF4294 domain-containing protein [Candidatus Merdimorpha stercoravium]|uniref:DUF4294 domain-containing protein n=1 Tax=Candidatus Merdimorpha stercoravium TaxID=2840863 RepID=A0A9D1KTA4_9FLAO|nr:DUF4294 domain-containing protein [Candidatus Merdimorpha stercoravium]